MTDDLSRCARCGCLPCRCDIEYPVIDVEDCSTCAARCNGMDADYCSHTALADEFPGEGKPILRYPTKPAWCPGYIAENEDFEWC